MERRPLNGPAQSCHEGCRVAADLRDRFSGTVEIRTQSEAVGPGLPPEERESVLRAIAYEMMLDPEAPFRPEPVLYQDFQVRCRIRKVGIGPVPLAEFKLHLNIARSGIDPAGVDGAAWDRAIGIARTIPDDMQAVYLILAGAALSAAPCPSDAEVARRCGMHSAGRARSRIKHLDKGDLVVTRTDMSGRRIAVLPDLGWETAAGDPNGPPQSRETDLSAAE